MWDLGIKGSEEPLKAADPADLWESGTCPLRARQPVTCWVIAEARPLMEALCFQTFPETSTVRTRVELALQQGVRLGVGGGVERKPAIQPPTGSLGRAPMASELLLEKW